MEGILIVWGISFPVQQKTLRDMSYADASDLNLSDMGTMGMGGGFKGGFGGTNENR